MVSEFLRNMTNYDYTHEGTVFSSCYKVITGTALSYGCFSVVCSVTIDTKTYEDLFILNLLNQFPGFPFQRQNGNLIMGHFNQCKPGV